jgi:diguanylate cyclase (GGDEF)-like protein
METNYKTALENKNLHLTLLYDIARTLSEWVQTEDVDDVYQEILAIVGCMLDYHELVLMIYEPQKQKLKVAATYGIENPEELINMEFSVGEGVTGVAIEKKKPIYVPNTRQDKRYLYYKGQKPEDVSFMSVPLLGASGDTLIGALNVSRPANEPFQQQERETVQAVSHLISVAITNAHLYRQLTELSVRDELTGLYNRRHGQETIHHEITRANRFHRSLSILMIDIDHFKRFNDLYGHPKGDVMLHEFSVLLEASLRDVDYITRWGGEEFLVILPNTDVSGALNVAEKLRHNVRQCTFAKLRIRPRPQFTVSIGVASFPDTAKNETDLILYADKALYEAKGTGRDRVVVAKTKGMTRKVG